MEQVLHSTKTDGVFAEVPISDLDATLAELRTRPGVTSVAAFTYIRVELRRAPPAARPTIGGFAGFPPVSLTTIYRPVIVEGRQPTLGERTRSRST